MDWIKVTTQKELDKEVKLGNGVIIDDTWADSSSAELRGSSSAVLRDFSMAHHHGQKVKVLSNVATAIEVIYPDTVEEWVKLKGLKIRNGAISLWKAVREDGTDFYTGKVKYEIGKEVVDPNWSDTFSGECGYALHLSDSPSGARIFVQDEHLLTFRLFKVRAKLEDCKVFGGNPQYPMKLRAKKCVPIKEYPRDYQE
jgi:hypothetical protein